MRIVADKITQRSLRRGLDGISSNIFSSSLFSSPLPSVKMNSSLGENLFPDVADLARLSADVYTAFDKPANIPEWKYIAAARYKDDGYRGAAYQNTSNGHVVIVHGGTDFNILHHPRESLKDVWTDIVGVWLGCSSSFSNIQNIEKIIKVSQITSALAFSQMIVNNYYSNAPSISMTGHSLGGWLAQICAMYIEHPRLLQNERLEAAKNQRKEKLEIKGQFYDQCKSNVNYHLHTVVFESPGCKKTFAKILDYQRYNLNKKREWEEFVGALDITVIIAPAYWISRADEHVGYLLQTMGESSHGINFLVDYLSCSSPLPKLFEVHEAHMGKAAELGAETRIHKWLLGGSNYCRVSIFNPRERKVLSFAQQLFEWISRDHLENREDDRLNKDIATVNILNQLTDCLKINGKVIDFKIMNPLVSFCQKVSNESKSNEFELVQIAISNLLVTFRKNRNWTSETLKDAISQLDSCRQVFYKIEHRAYLKKIPVLIECSSLIIRDGIIEFLEQNESNVLTINAGAGHFATRLLMINILPCLSGKASEILCLNSLGVKNLNRYIDIRQIFTKQPELKLIVIEIDSYNEEDDISDLIDGMVHDIKRSGIGQKLILLSKNEGVDLLDPRENLKLEVDNLTDESRDFLISYRLNIQKYEDEPTFTVSLGKSTTSDHYLLAENEIRSFLDGEDGPEIIIRMFNGESIDLGVGALPKLAPHYIPRTLYQICLDVDKVSKNEMFSDPIFISNSDELCCETMKKDLHLLFSKGKIFFKDDSFTLDDFIEACENDDINFQNAEFERQFDFDPENIIGEVLEYENSDDGDDDDDHTEKTDDNYENSDDDDLDDEIPEVLKNLNIKPENITVDLINKTLAATYSTVSFFKNAHWFKWEKGHLVWQRSIGDPCWDYLTDEDEKVEELDMLKLENNSIVLADEPGMGKSAALINFYLKFREGMKSQKRFKWPIYIDLNAHKVTLNGLDYNGYEDVSFVTEALNIQGNKLSTALLKSLIGEYCNGVSLFIDSYDEISESGQIYISAMLSNYKESCPRLSSWVATRDYVKGDLERKLRTKAYRFYRVEENAQKEYLKNYWVATCPQNDIPIPNTNVHKLGEYLAGFAINEIKRVLGEQDTFIGVPQQLVLLALVHESEFKRLVKESTTLDTTRLKDAVKFESILELYELFVSKKHDIWLNKKVEGFAEWDKESLMNNIDRIHSKIGYLALEKSIFSADDPSIPTEKLTAEDSFEANRAGIFKVQKESKPIYVPLPLYERIKKTGDTSQECIDTIVLSLDDPDHSFSKKLVSALSELATAKIIIGCKHTFSQLEITESRGQMHLFEEDINSKVKWQQSICKSFSGEKININFQDSMCERICVLSYRFTHQTLAEFFAAKYLVSLIRQSEIGKANAVKFLKEQYYKPVFKKVRYFLDSYLCTCFQRLKRLENFHISFGQKATCKVAYLKQNCFSPCDWYVNDKLGRNILHYAAAYGDYDCGIFWMIAENLELFHQTDDLGASCMSYALLSEQRKMQNYDDLLFFRSADGPYESALKKCIYFYFCGQYFQHKLQAPIETANKNEYENLTKEFYRLHLVAKTKCLYKMDYRDIAKEELEKDLHRQNSRYPDRLNTLENFQVFLSVLNDPRKTALLNQKIDIKSEWYLANMKNSRDLYFLGWIFQHNLRTSSSEADEFLLRVFKTALKSGKESYRDVAGKLVNITNNMLDFMHGSITKILNPEILSNYKILVLKEVKESYEALFLKLNSSSELELWKSCSDLEKERLVEVMRSHNYANFFRLAYCQTEFFCTLYERENIHNPSEKLQKVVALIFKLFVAGDCVMTNEIWNLIANACKNHREDIWFENFQGGIDIDIPGSNTSIKYFDKIFKGKSKYWVRINNNYSNLPLDEIEKQVFLKSRLITGKSL